MVKVRSVSMWCLAMMGFMLFTSAAGSQQVATQTTKEDPSSQPASDLKDDLEKALLSTTSFDGLAVTARQTPTGLWVLNVAAGGVGWNAGTTDNSEHSEATVVAGWYDAENKLMGNMAQEQAFKRVIPDGDAVYSLPVVVPAGAVRLRFVVRDALNGRMGTLDLPVQAAGKGK